MQRRLFAATLTLAFGLLALTSASYGQTMILDTLKVREEGAVMFAEIAAPPMNLLGPELVRDLVSLIQRAEADNAIQVLVFKSAGAGACPPSRRASPSRRSPGSRRGYC